MQMNRIVPILRICLDSVNDLIQDYHLSCASIHALMRLQPPEGIHNWGHHITIFITVYCLVHSLSYSDVLGLLSTQDYCLQECDLE